MASLCVPCGELGRGDEGRDGEEGGEIALSEVLDLALPLLKTPGGTDRVRNIGSWSIVGILGKSEYVKYAVRCHFLGFVFGDVTTYAE